MEKGEKRGGKKTNPKPNPKLEGAEPDRRGGAGRRPVGMLCVSPPWRRDARVGSLAVGYPGGGALTPKHPWFQASAVAPGGRASTGPCLLLVKGKGPPRTSPAP